MSQVTAFFLTGHDARFVALAAVVCMISAYACMSLIQHAHRAHGRMRILWNAIAALAVGFGIWATHFIAVLAFRPGFSFSYDVLLTSVSLATAILICGVGIAMAIRSCHRADHFLGGAVVGIGISTMHYTGIAALIMGGTIGWSPAMVAGSILAGMLLAGISGVVAMSRMRFARLSGALILTLAICAMHFTAMGAADFSRCFPLVYSSAGHDHWLSIAVFATSILILGAASGSVVLDEADHRRTAREQARQVADAMRISEVTKRLELAMKHMAQGLGLYDAQGTLQLHNDRLGSILGIPAHVALTGRSFREVTRLAIIGPGEANADLEDTTDAVMAQHVPLFAGGGEVVHELAGERIVRVTHSPISDGSWVTTVDDITERRRNEAAIAHLAHHDGLTGLPNRTSYNERLDAALTQAERSDGSLAVVAIDLDRFKEVNDSYGHAAGDHVLRALASRLTEILREGEVVARFGGDEFAAFKLFSSLEGLRDFVQRIETALFTRVEGDNWACNTSASIGIAVFPDDGSERSKLLSNADLAMYRAKAEFDRHIAYYEQEMDEHARARRAMARDIWDALERNAFHLVYQVQKSVKTNDVTGYEVLLRWDRPGFGAVSPADFIPVAEECGAIVGIGTWVLRMACLEAASWPEPIKIAVNISALQLAQVELIDVVRDTLIMSGLSPNRLELEVTETSIIGDKARALHVLRQIRAMGVSIAIDDFGTGYSSLDTLRSFPFDKIKLDRSFVNEVERDDQSKAIIRAILALGRSLSVPVLAEGVETREQLEVLRAEGCNEVQGFLLGRPGTIDWSDLLEPPLKIA